MNAFWELGESDENFLRSCVSATSKSIVVTPSVVNKGLSLRSRVPGVMSFVAIRPSPFPAIGAIFQRGLSKVGVSMPFGGDSGSVVRLGAILRDTCGDGY